VLRFILRRVLRGLVVIAGVTLVVFVVTRVIADPARMLLPYESSQEQYETLKASLGYDRPMIEQLRDFGGDVVTLDFGDSLWQRQPALELVMERLPRSLLLVVLSLGLAVLLAVPLGILASLRPSSALDKVAVVTSLLGLSVPQFWLGMLLIMLFAVRLGWFPTSGQGSIAQLVLPAIALALPAAGRITQMTRSSMIDEMSTAYVTTATAKGMRPRYIIRRHVLRNAAVPVVTMTGWELVRGLAGYTIVVETVFAWPGIGYLAVQAVERQDLPLIQAVVFVIAVVVVLVNFLMDVLYLRIDPRISIV
jgi:peptide/nickel transport system permease protein